MKSELVVECRQRRRDIQRTRCTNLNHTTPNKVIEGLRGLISINFPKPGQQQGRNSGQIEAIIQAEITSRVG